MQPLADVVVPSFHEATETARLVARLANLGEIFRVQGEILAAGRTTVPALAALLGGPGSVFPQPRVAAAECLGALGGEDALVALLAEVERDHRAADDPVTAMAEECVRNAAARQLIRFRAPRVTPVLLTALAEHHLIGAGETLAELGETAAIPHLIDCLEDDAKRGVALGALRRFGDAAIAALMRAARTPRYEAGREPPGSVIRRAHAAQLLGEFGASAAKSALADALHDPQPSVRVHAALALTEITPGDGCADTLLFGLGEADLVTQVECEAALGRLGSLASEKVRHAVTSGTVRGDLAETYVLNPAARRRTIALLSTIDPGAFVDVCQTLLHDPDVGVRYQTVSEVVKLTHPDRGALLAIAARDADRRVRDVARSAKRADDGGHRRWLNRNVIGMGLTSLLSDAGHEMATAILPAFLTAIGVSASALGAIEGIADAAASFAKLGSGWLSDRLGHRKPITVGGYALTGLSTGLFALAHGWPLVLAARTVGWFGRGVRGSLRDAMLVESVEPADVGKAFGFHRASDTIGAIIGPLLGVVLLELLQGLSSEPTAPFRAVFLMTVVPGLGSALALALMVRERRRDPNHGMEFWRSVRNLPRSYRRFLVGVFVFGLADFAPTLLILRATDLLAPLHGLAHAAQLAALLFALRNAAYAAASFPIGALGDRLGRRGLLAGGYALAALTFAGFLIQTPSLPYLALLFALAGVFIAVEDALEGATAADLLPADVRGLGYGVLGSVNGVGDLFSSLVVGLLWTHVSIAAGLTYAVILSLAGAVLIVRVR
jgi:MFS family permease